MSGGLCNQTVFSFTRTRQREDRRGEREKGRGPGAGRKGGAGMAGTVRAGSARSGQNSGSEGGERELGVLVLFFLMGKDPWSLTSFSGLLACVHGIAARARGKNLGGGRISQGSGGRGLRSRLVREIFWEMIL